MFLRNYIRSADSRITERISYGLPFFYFKKPLCYLNCKTDGVDVGFHYGVRLQPRPQLIATKRKLVRSLFFTWDEDVDQQMLQQVLLEAIALQRT